MAEWVDFQENGVRGTVTSEAVPLLRSWLSGASQEVVVRERKIRPLCRLETTPPLFVKKFFRRGCWGMERRRAEREFSNLRTAASRSVPVPRVVAVLHRPEASVVVTYEVPRARTVLEILRDGVEFSRRRDLFEGMGRLVARMDEAGLEHFDLHAGNILISGDRFSEPLLCDLHQAVFRRPSSRRRVFAVMRLLHSLLLRSTLTDRLRLAAAAGLDREETRQVIRSWEEYRRSWVRAWAERGPKNEPKPERTQGGWRRKGFDPDPAIAEADATPPRKTSRYRSIRVLSGGLAARVYDYRGIVGKARLILSGDEGKRFWRNALALRAMGVPVPKLLAWVRRGGRSYLIGEWVPDAVALAEYVKTAPDRRALVRQVARFVRSLHEEWGVYHGDLTAYNILVVGGGAEPRLVLIDLGRVRFYSRVPIERRMFNLAQLNASVAAPLTRADRLAFYEAYAWGSRSWNEKKKEIIAEIMRKTRLRRHYWP